MSINERRQRSEQQKKEKINLEDILAPFKVSNSIMFKSYLKEIGQDLAHRTDDKVKGIAKLTFASYYHLPGIISDRLFAVMAQAQSNNSTHIPIKDFIKGMNTLYCKDYDRVSKFIFDFYDFDKDGKIAREDIRIVLSYITLNKNEEEDGLDILGYNARVHSQEELHMILDKCFENAKEQVLNYKDFCSVVENINSDVYLMILLFLYENKPFTKLGLAEYEKQFLNKSPNTAQKKESVNENLLIASPTKTSKFSPYKRLINVQNRRKTTMTDEKSTLNKEYFIKMNPMEDDIRKVETNKKDIINLKGMNEGDNKVNNDKDKGNDDNKDNDNDNDNDDDDGLGYRGGGGGLGLGSNDNNDDDDDEDDTIGLGYVKKKTTPNRMTRERGGQVADYRKCSEQIKPPSNTLSTPVIRKQKINLKDIHKQEVHVIGQYQDINILPSFLKNKKNNYHKDTDSNNSNSPRNDTNQINEDPNENDDGKSDSDSEAEVDKNIIKHEGYLCKLSNNKLKKIWFKLLGKDLYFYKKKTSDIHNGLHNLSGVFLQLEPNEKINGQEYYAFSIEYPKKKRFYYVETKAEYDKWIEKMKQATEFTELEALYTIGNKVGNGKFGLIKSGMNKVTGKKVAIKIMAKKNMSQQDLQLVRTEIEILKICQHPNIIRLYEVFENITHFHIIMEYCGGGDLYSYLEDRDFVLTEKHACDIIHKMCTAIYYIHSYGVAHRDLKPENVLMTDKTNEADIRILDFGLSKIIGPDEKCTEPYGTLSYVAPEVLLEQPYTKAVDLWSIGIITYLCLAGALPFDHPSNDEIIAKQTISEKQSYKAAIWKDISPEAKNFIDLLLEKNPDKRINIKEALDHKWFQKHFKSISDNRRMSSEFKGSAFQLYSSPNGIGINK